MQPVGNLTFNSRMTKSRHWRWRYDEHTWPEIKQRLAEKPQPVVILPIGAVEDHGAHMALNTDNVILEGIVYAAAQRAPQDMLVLPTIPYGFDEHHMDFPGTISIGIHTLIDFASEVAMSAARHGFDHVLIVNGHGSNHAICDLVARNVVVKTGIICASMSPNAAIDPTLAQDVIDAERQSQPGGIAHACEYETSAMLYLRPDLVDMALAEADFGQLKLKYFNWDHGVPSVLSWQDWWSRFSRVGVAGDASVATAKFGEHVIQITVERFIEMVQEFRHIPIQPRVDHH
jgi:creatinine amidohydrolase